MPIADPKPVDLAVAGIDRRRFLKDLTGAAAVLGAGRPSHTGGATRDAQSPINTPGFTTRGYYIILSRMPTFGLSEWKRILRYMKEDECNFLILWVGGGFRSKRFPITWQYNRSHQNVEKDFVRQLIDFGHSLNVKIVLGFTPFSYDGVNQYPLKRPDLKAYQKNGALTGLGGIDCWGYALNPSKADAQTFMLDYASEMYFDFYPNADGLFIESSDYAICYCPYCLGHYYEREFEFVKRISERVWKAKADATVVVYPHYFSGAEIPHFGRGEREKYDPRWTLFFTPHSAPIRESLVRMASSSISWEPIVLLTPDEIKARFQNVRERGVTGLVASLECESFVARFPEGGDWNFIGERMKPFGYAWLDDDADSYGYLLTKVLRTAYREFSRDPDLPLDTFRTRLRKGIFLDSTPDSAVDDLLEWQAAYATDRGWFLAGPVMSPEILQRHLELGRVKPAQLENYSVNLNRLKAIRQKYQRSLKDPNVIEMLRVIDWTLARWAGKEAILQPPYHV